MLLCRFSEKVVAMHFLGAFTFDEVGSLRKSEVCSVSCQCPVPSIMQLSSPGVSAKYQGAIAMASMLSTFCKLMQDLAIRLMSGWFSKYLG